MDLLKDVQSALIIDNLEKDVEHLIEILNGQGIYTTYFKPEELNTLEAGKLKNHQLIFLDFSLNDDFTESASNISLMRNCLMKVCVEGFGAYGLVIWTKHPGELGDIQKRLAKDVGNNKYEMPLFVVCMDKNKYMENQYESLMDDLNAELLKNKAATFFFGWRQTVDKGANKALKDMYTLVLDYPNQEKAFLYLLSQLAHLYSGAPNDNGNPYYGMMNDACMAFNELMHYDVTASQHDMTDVFCSNRVHEVVNIDFSIELAKMATINSKLLIDESENGNALIIPGNVYRVKQDIPLLKLPTAPEGSWTIAIEVTPPCDFQNKKEASRLIGGFMIDCPADRAKIKELKNKFDLRELQYLVYPIYYNKEIKFVCFDFRHLYGLSDEELKNSTMFEYLFTAKNRLFADILQKYSSHAARLGLAYLHP